MEKIGFKLFLGVWAIILLSACSKDTTYSTILDFDQGELPGFIYFANGHLDRESYLFRIVRKDGKTAGEIVKAFDASSWSGLYTDLKKPIDLSEGKVLEFEAWMDHIGTLTLKLEKLDVDSNDTNVSLTVSNTISGQWEKMYFDFKDLVNGSPVFSRLTIIPDLNFPNAEKDRYSYFSAIRQMAPRSKRENIGDPQEAVKIVVLGSSTAAGTGPVDIRNAWVNRYRKMLHLTNSQDQVINLAVGGYTTYHLLPSGTVVPLGKPMPDGQHNVTKALEFTPDAVIINLPSNDSNNGFTVEEQLKNYKIMLEPLISQDIPFWVTTTQGRNFEEDKKQIQKQIRDSTFALYGERTIDFWSGLADSTGSIKPKFDSGDGVHLNDEGHRILFERVWEKDIPGFINNKRKALQPKDNSVVPLLNQDAH